MIWPKHIGFFTQHKIQDAADIQNVSNKTEICCMTSAWISLQPKCLSFKVRDPVGNSTHNHRTSNGTICWKYTFKSPQENQDTQEFSCFVYQQAVVPHVVNPIRNIDKRFLGRWILIPSISMHYLYMFTKLIMLYGTGIVPLPSTHYLVTFFVAEITICVDGIPFQNHAYRLVIWRSYGTSPFF